MDRINETKINSFDYKNGIENEDFPIESDSDSIDNYIDLEMKEKQKISEIIPKEVAEERKKKFKSKLEFLLSQNDILPLLKQLRDNGKNEIFNGIDYKNDQNENGFSAKKARLAKNNENDVFNDDDIEYVKVENQPVNLVNGNLKEYQLEALNWLLKLHNMKVNGILADEMGLGKTIQTISLLAYLEGLKSKEEILNRNSYYIIIIPKVTLSNWKREVSKWFPGLRVLVFYGDKEERRSLAENELRQRNFDLIITTYEVAIKDKTVLTKLKYEYLIIDEAHRIKNEKSKLSFMVRQYKSAHRLLLTGTPLQNNLHELWALLNFLMPDIFDDSQEFDKIFDLDSANEEDQHKIVKQIHMLLRPFVLRRLKSEVEFKLPPKKEIYLFVGLSDIQKTMYRNILSKNIDIVNGITKDKLQLLNILMQLKKVCNHPYLFPGVEKGPPFEDGEHIVENSMKLKILDVLLKKLKNEGSRVLIFSQMTSLLNILDDYCRYRHYTYCRIDGSTSSIDRDLRIEQFQAPGSDVFIFLLSTRAGGLGINLHSANNVIIYDSDWNPQADLQAIDRAHRIGQTKPVNVYRFVTEGTVEEKIVERAAKKLKIDHLIIQKGKSEKSKVSALEMTSILQYGAQNLFDTKDANQSESLNIEEILDYSMNKTEKLKEPLKNIEEKLNINNLSLTSGRSDIYKFEGEDFKKRDESSNFIIPTFHEAPRVRVLVNPALEEKKKIEYRRIKTITGWRLKAGGGYPHQFFNFKLLDELDAKEKLSQEQKNDENQNSHRVKKNEWTKEDEELRKRLISEGFPKWTKKDLSKFIKACEMYGYKDSESVSRYMRTKTPEEVERYCKVFIENVHHIPGGKRILMRINKYENEKEKIMEYQEILENKFDEISNDHTDIFKNLKIPYKVLKNKKNVDLSFNEEEDKYLVCLLIKYGYGNWNLIKAHILTDPTVKFNFNLKIKNTQDLTERSNFLINCFKNAINVKNKKQKGSTNKKISRKKKKIKKSKKIVKTKNPYYS